MTSVGRYQVLEQLGRGAMGVVYKAFDPAIGRTVAIKAIRLGEFADPDERIRVRERLLREAQSAGLLSDSSIVTIYDVLEEESSAYIFMEFVRGRSLDALLRSGELPPRAELLGYLRQVAQALDYAHRKDVIHRDIKPGNILLAESEEGGEKTAKVADFGVAKFISQDTTHSGTMMGTPSYMSPEQIQGLASDGRSDQFSFAVVVYELLTGQKPFAADGLPALFYQICKVDARAAHEVEPTLSAAASLVLARALAKNPDDRFASCLEFQYALSEALNGPVAATETAPRALVAAASSAASAAAAKGSTVVSAGPPLPPGPSALPVEDWATPARRNRQTYAEDEAEGRRSLLFKLVVVIAVCVVAGVLFFFLRRTDQPQQRAASSSAPVGTAAETSKPDLATSVPVPPPASLNPAPARPAEANKALPPAMVQTEILSEPARAFVTVDESPKLHCTAPCELSLAPGRHTLTAVLDGYNMARRVFTLPGESDVRITLPKREGALVLTTTPSGATVLVDGKEYGKTPITLHLTPGAHQVVMVNGELRHEETFTIANDGFEARTFRW